MPGENPERLQWTKRQKCCAPGAPGGCSSVIEAHHAGRRGVGQKAPDDTAIPLCTTHHRAWHDHRGPFSLSNAERRVWSDERISETQQRWAEAWVTGPRLGNDNDGKPF
jgi:hypothetical protein